MGRPAKTKKTKVRMAFMRDQSYGRATEERLRKEVADLRAEVAKLTGTVVHDEPVVMAYWFRKWGIPDYTFTGIKRYVEERKPVGGFLRAVICNDLRNACGYADDTNIENLPAYCAYFYNHAPSDCHGSVEKYKAWIKPWEDAHPARDDEDAQLELEEDPC
jgi:hypothetical protein